MFSQHQDKLKLNDYDAESLKKALALAEKDFGNKLTRVFVSKRNPTAITNENWQIKLLELLSDDSHKSNLRSYKYLVLSHLFNRHAQDDAQAHNFVKSVRDQLKRQHEIEYELSLEKTKQLKELLKANFDITDALNLIKEGANPHFKSKSVHALLNTLIVSDGFKIEILKELVEKHGANINAACDHCGETPLQSLLNILDNIDQLNTAIELVRLGADANSRSKVKLTILHFLATSQIDFSKEIRELVTQYNANMHQSTPYITPSPYKKAITQEGLEWLPHVNNIITLKDLLKNYPEPVEQGFSLSKLSQLFFSEENPKPSEQDPKIVAPASLKP